MYKFIGLTIVIILLATFFITAAGNAYACKGGDHHQDCPTTEPQPVTEEPTNPPATEEAPQEKDSGCGNGPGRFECRGETTPVPIETEVVMMLLPEPGGTRFPFEIPALLIGFAALFTGFIHKIVRL